MPKKRGLLPADLRTAARVPIAKKRLADVLGSVATAAAGSRLWLGDRWPWTPGTDAALATRRPRWAVFAMDLGSVVRFEQMDPEIAVREMNREHDPWPVESRKAVGSIPPAVRVEREEAISEPPSSPRRR